jgi:hypothetical protein
MRYTTLIPETSISTGSPYASVVFKKVIRSNFASNASVYIVLGSIQADCAPRLPDALNAGKRATMQDIAFLA